MRFLKRLEIFNGHAKLFGAEFSESGQAFHGLAMNHKTFTFPNPFRQSGNLCFPLASIPDVSPTRERPPAARRNTQICPG
jgi:hypothetical protein